MIYLVIAEDSEHQLSLAQKTSEELGNVTRVPETWDFETIVARLASRSLMGDRMTYLLTDRDILSEETTAADRLVTMLGEKRLCHNLVLVTAKKLKHPLYDLLKKEKTLVEFQAPRKGQVSASLAEILDHALSSVSAAMEPAAKKELLLRTGNDSQRMVQEARKLAIHAGDSPITPAMVRALVVDESVEDFGLQNAIRTRNGADLLKQARRLIETGLPWPALLAQLINEIRRLAILSCVLGSRSRILSRNEFIYQLHPDLVKEKDVVTSLDRSLARNWTNAYYLVHLYLALKAYGHKELLSILKRLGSVHIETRGSMSPEDALMVSIVNIGGKHG